MMSMFIERSYIVVNVLLGISSYVGICYHQVSLTNLPVDKSHI
jgi:hypothetical protein